MLRAEAFDDIVDAIYAAALDASRWRALVDLLVRGFDGVGASVFTPFAGRLGLEPIWSTDADADFIAEYASRSGHSDPMVPPLLQRIPSPSFVYCFDDLVRRSDLERWDGYPAMLRHKARQGIGLMVNCDSHRAAQAMVYTWETDDRRVEDVKAGLLRLERHFKRAIEIHWHLVEARRAAAVTSLTLDMFCTGAAWLSESGEVLYANREMEGIFSARDGIFRSNGILAFSRQETNRWLRTAIQEARADRCAAIATERPFGTTPYRINVVPLPTHATALRLNQAAAIAFISEASVPTAASVDAAVRIYGLTPAEARVTFELVTGYDAQAISDRLGSSLNTVRTQVKSILAKAGVTRQADLVRLVATMPQIDLDRPSDT